MCFLTWATQLILCSHSLETLKGASQGQGTFHAIQTNDCTEHQTDCFKAIALWFPSDYAQE